MRSKKKRTKTKAKTKATTARKRSTRRSSKKSVKTKSAPTKKLAKRRSRPRTATLDPAREVEQEIRNKRLSGGGTTSGRQSDFRGLSRAEEADSESVDELVEEGNVFEAGAVAGVEEADNADEREVVTHEVPEDDVPEEYLDKE